MPTLVLAGDIGGTKTNLALYEVGAGDTLTRTAEATYPSRDYPGLEPIVREFLAAHPARPAAAAFGIAGPVVDGRVTATNLPWQITPEGLAEASGAARIQLMNDLESTAFGVFFLPPDQLHSLNPGQRRPGNRAVIAAGTGLGQAVLFRHGEHYVPSATEGGHTDFAPRDEREIRLLNFLRHRFGRVSYERIVSGPGLHNVFDFVADDLKREVAPLTRKRMEAEDPSAVISHQGLSAACPASAEAVEMFLSIYGAQAGNLALTVLAVGGIYVAGGIVVKMLEGMKRGGFMQAFTAKGRQSPLMAQIPVDVVLNDKTSLLGAGHAARELLG